MTHILLSKASRFPVKLETRPSGWSYSRQLGVWRSDDANAEPQMKPVSKKQDVETGEDMKGE